MTILRPARWMKPVGIALIAWAGIGLALAVFLALLPRIHEAPPWFQAAWYTIDAVTTAAFVGLAVGGIWLVRRSPQRTGPRETRSDG